MRYTKKDIEKFLSRPMGLVAEFKTEMTFASDVLREIDPINEAFNRKNRRVIFIGGKAFVKEDISDKRWKHGKK
jgi:hypothetical protein